VQKRGKSKIFAVVTLLFFDSDKMLVALKLHLKSCNSRLKKQRGGRAPSRWNPNGGSRAEPGDDFHSFSTNTHF